MEPRHRAGRENQRNHGYCPWIATSASRLAARPVETLRFFWALRALMRMQRLPR